MKKEKFQSAKEGEVTRVYGGVDSLRCTTKVYSVREHNNPPNNVSTALLCGAQRLRVVWPLPFRQTESRQSVGVSLRRIVGRLSFRQITNHQLSGQHHHSRLFRSLFA